MKYDRPSALQEQAFVGFAGKPYPEGTQEGQFSTDRPYNEPWQHSPWLVTYRFDRDSGKLFVELDHRMTNNRTVGWDYQGNVLPDSEVDAVFPPHF